MNNKVVVITGASNGLGRELVKIYIRNNYRIIVTGRKKEKLVEFADRADLVVGDLTSNKTLERIVKIIKDKYKKIDILINNAGIVHIQPFEKNTYDQLDSIFEINVKSHIKLTQKVYPYMQKQRSGHIINIISTAGLEGKYNHTMYCATKHAMRGFTESLRLEAKKYNIKVTGIYPGGIKTHIFDNLTNKIDQSTFMDPANVAMAVYNLSLIENISQDSLIISRMTWISDTLYGNKK